MCYRGKVHNFLYAGFAEHCASGLTTGINIGMITENRKSMCGNCAGRNVEYARKQFAGNLVKVRDHEQKALGSGIGCGQRTGCKRTVHSTGSTGLRLHLGNLNNITENVLPTFGCPLIYMLRHYR